jgi:O-antigen/teichoic acid export membrane protein
MTKTSVPFGKRIIALLIHDISLASMVVFATSFINAVLNMLVVGKIARDLGPQQFGPYAAALALGGTVSMLIGGFQIAVANSTAETKNEYHFLQGSVKRLVINPLIGLGLFLALIWIVLSASISSFIGINVKTIISLSVVLPITAAVSVVDGVLFGLGKFRFVQSLSVVNTIFKLAFVFVFLTIHGSVIVLPLIVYISALPTIFIAAFVAKNENIKLPSLRSIQLWRTNILVLLFWISLQMDVLVSNRVFESTDAGLYSSFATIGKAMTSLSLLIGFYLIPRFHRVHGSKRDERQLINRAVFAATLEGGGIALGIYWIDIIKKILGKSYELDKHLELLVLISHVPWCVVVCLVQLRAARNTNPFMASIACFVAFQFLVFTQVSSIVWMSIAMIWFGLIGALLVYINLQLID